VCSHDGCGAEVSLRRQWTRPRSIFSLVFPGRSAQDNLHDPCSNIERMTPMHRRHAISALTLALACLTAGAGAGESTDKAGGKDDNLQTAQDFANFEMYVDWKIDPSGDSGIYLRGNPQVQIWDLNGKNNPKHIGSGGLYNNQKNPSNPLVVADNPVGQWNTF